jgi:hypothetical protein
MLQKTEKSATNNMVEPNFKPNIKMYDVATTIFNAQKYFGAFCDRCKNL